MEDQMVNVLGRQCCGQLKKMQFFISTKNLLRLQLLFVTWWDLEIAAYFLEILLSFPFQKWGFS